MLVKDRWRALLERTPENMPVEASCWCKRFQRRKRSFRHPSHSLHTPESKRRSSQADTLARFSPAAWPRPQHKCHQVQLNLPEASLDIDINPMAEEEYKEALQVPGLFGLQLTAAGATVEDMHRFPARLTNEDSLRLLRFAKARQSFRGYADNSGHFAPLDIESIPTGLQCSQETLDTLVKALYSRRLSVGSSNAAELLAAADYLQADCLVSAIAAHIKRNVSVENGLQIFCLGQGYPGLGLQEAATDAICSAKDSTLTACLFARCGYDNVAEQLVVVKGLAAHKSLVEVMEAIQVNEAMGGWQLREPHIRVLMELYPTLQTPLSCLLDPDPCQAVQCRPRRNLFSVCLASLDNTSSIEWRLPLSVLVKTERQSLAVLCSPATLLVDGLRRFELQMQFIDGKWGLYVNAVNTAWRKEDQFDIVCIAKASVRVRVSWVPQMHDGSSFGIRKTFNWLQHKHMLLEGGTILGARLERVQVL